MRGALLVAVLAACCAGPRSARHEPADPGGPPGEWRPAPPPPALTQPEVMEAMARTARPFSRCLGADAGEAHGRATVRWRFARTGLPVDVEVTDAPAAIAACLSEAATASLRVREHQLESREVFDLSVKF